jgi:2-dehydropantoate 2-reductase
VTRYAVVGAGAIGGTLAFALARDGHDVVVVDADVEHVRAIQAHGLIVRAADGTQRAARLPALTPDRIGTLAPLRRVILAVKSQATGPAVEAIAPHLDADGYIACVQNGMNAPRVAERVGSGRTVAAFVNFAADVVGAGVIGEGGPGALVVGEGDGRASSRVEALVADLQAWGPARSSTNVPGYLWSKMGYAAMLVATSLVDDDMADVIDRHRGVMHRLVREVFSVAQSEGIRLEAFDAFDPTGYVPGAHATAAELATDRLTAWLHTLSKKRSGIWRDIAVRHRPTEVPFQYAPILARATQARVEVPALRALLETLRRVEAGDAPMGDGLVEAIARA